MDASWFDQGIPVNSLCATLIDLLMIAWTKSICRQTLLISIEIPIKLHNHSMQDEKIICGLFQLNHRDGSRIVCVQTWRRQARDVF